VYPPAWPGFEYGDREVAGVVLGEFPDGLMSVTMVSLSYLTVLTVVFGRFSGRLRGCRAAQEGESGLDQLFGQVVDESL